MGIVILCCVLGTIVDCVVHVYKYWCNCVNKACRYHQTEMVSLRGSPAGGGGGGGTATNTAGTQTTPSTTEPTLVLVRAMPPSYSAVVVSCDAAGSTHSRLAPPGGSRPCPATVFTNPGAVSPTGAPGETAGGPAPARETTTQIAPPSYSSVFRNDYVTFVAEGGYQAMDGFLVPPR